MADEIIKRDGNRITVLAGITDNAAQEIRMLRVDSNGRVKASATTAGSGTWAKETPTGLINGVNTTYTIAHSAIANSADVVLNGQVLTEGVDYTLSATTLTMLTAISADFSSLPFIIKYQY